MSEVIDYGAECQLYRSREILKAGSTLNVEAHSSFLQEWQ